MSENGRHWSRAAPHQFTLANFHLLPKTIKITSYSNLFRSQCYIYLLHLVLQSRWSVYIYMCVSGARASLCAVFNVPWEIRHALNDFDYCYFNCRSNILAKSKKQSATTAQHDERTTVSTDRQRVYIFQMICEMMFLLCLMCTRMRTSICTKFIIESFQAHKWISQIDLKRELHEFQPHKICEHNIFTYMITTTKKMMTM